MFDCIMLPNRTSLGDLIGITVTTMSWNRWRMAEVPEKYEDRDIDSYY